MPNEYNNYLKVVEGGRVTAYEFFDDRDEMLARFALSRVLLLNQRSDRSPVGRQVVAYRHAPTLDRLSIDAFVTSRGAR